MCSLAPTPPPHHIHCRNLSEIGHDRRPVLLRSDPQARSVALSILIPNVELIYATIRHTSSLVLNFQVIGDRALPQVCVVG